VAELEAMAINAATRDPELMSDAELAGVLEAITLPGEAPAAAPADAA
jgi:hypothetical protein